MEPVRLFLKKYYDRMVLSRVREQFKAKDLLEEEHERLRKDSIEEKKEGNISIRSQLMNMTNAKIMLKHKNCIGSVCYGRKL